MKAVIFALACGVAGSASAGAELSDCQFPDSPVWETGEVIVCNVTNTSTTAIAALSYGVALTEPSRTVPWLDTTGKPPRAASAIPIPGGIEPGEMLPITFLNPGNIPDGADSDKIDISVVIAEARDVNGIPITSGDE